MVVDTHIFIWYALDDLRLPLELKAAMQRSPEKVFLPSVCLWEALMLVEKGRLELRGKNPARALKSFVEIAGFQETPLTIEIALLSRTLEFEHDDPADRFIAATARAKRLPLATMDRRLRSLPWLQIA